MVYLLKMVDLSMAMLVITRWYLVPLSFPGDSPFISFNREDTLTLHQRDGLKLSRSKKVPALFIPLCANVVVTDDISFLNEYTHVANLGQNDSYLDMLFVTLFYQYMNAFCKTDVGRMAQHG